MNRESVDIVGIIASASASASAENPGRSTMGAMVRRGTAELALPLIATTLSR